MKTSPALVPAETGFSSNESVFAAFRQGDRLALKHVYKECWPVVAGYVRQNNGTPADAEELLQEAIIVLYEKSRDNGFRLTCAISTYLFAVCRNTWLHTLRRRRHTDSLGDQTDIPADDSSNEQPFGPSEEELTNAVLKLGEPCQHLLLGYYFKKLSLEQLATQLNYASPNVAKQRKFKCLERLKKMFSSRESNSLNR